MNASMNEDAAFTPEKFICKCGHPATRHISNGERLEGANNAIWCMERFCSCSGFQLNHIAE